MKHIYQLIASGGYVFQSYQFYQPLRSMLTALLCLVLTGAAMAQLTIKVTGVPMNTPAGADIYVAGNFNNWNPADPARKLTPIGNGKYMVTLNPAPGQVEFKFTRGSWATVEGNIGGLAQPSHKIFYNGQPKTVEVVILSWPDLLNGGGGTLGPTEGSINIVSNNYYIPELSRTRRIWIYLPPSYGINPGRRYPVMYMQDGQNLFDPNAVTTGDWKVDEAMDQLAQNGDPGCIIVGIDNGGVQRVNEYAPWVNPAYGGGEGISYVNFIVNTLKPYIDNNYLTASGRDYTGIMGSSMGGLISMYALIEHQDVFSKAGVFSPSFWFNGDKTVEHILSKGKLNDVRVFFLAGGMEPTYINNDVEEVVEAMLTVGFSLDEISNNSPSDGEHSEWFWSREFPVAYQWLFEDMLPVVSSQEATQASIELQVYPNPATDWIRLKGIDLNQSYQVRIVDMSGKIWRDEIQQGDEAMWTGDLPRGAYAVAVSDEDGYTLSLQLMHE